MLLSKVLCNLINKIYGILLPCTPRAVLWRENAAEFSELNWKQVVVLWIVCSVCSMMPPWEENWRNSHKRTLSFIGKTDFPLNWVMSFRLLPFVPLSHVSYKCCCTIVVKGQKIFLISRSEENSFILFLAVILKKLQLKIKKGFCLPHIYKWQQTLSRQHKNH